MGSLFGTHAVELIAAGKNLSELVHFGANQVFENATTYTCLMFLKRAGQASFRFVRVDDLKDWTKTQLATEAPLKAEKVSRESWSFNIGHGSELIDRLKAYKGCPRRAGYPGYASFIFPQPQRGCIISGPERCNPVGVENHFESLTQGSRSAPTLGWRPLPRWGKPNRA